MKKRSLVQVITLAGSAFMAIALFVYVLGLHPNILVGKQSQQLKIPYGTSFKALKNTLQQHDYVSNATSFSLWARFMRYDRQIIPGVYQLAPNMSNWEIIQILKKGTQQPVKVVLYSVRTKEELATQITQNLEISANDFKKLLDDSAFVSRYGFNLDNVMTMFVPNTYEVYWTVTPERLFARMHKEHQRFWNTSRRKKAESLKMSSIEIAILASIVQKETNKLDEAPLIAGVYISRLRKKIALQSCPTLLYALGDPSARRVLQKHKNFDSLYNTYKYRGLPPGPICLPSIAMIDAALNSTPSDYLYFSAKEDFSGYHYFSRSLKEHLRYAKRYQKALNKARIYR